MANFSVRPMMMNNEARSPNKRGANMLSSGPMMMNSGAGGAQSPVSARPQVGVNDPGARDAVSMGEVGARDAVSMGEVGARDAIAPRDSVGGKLADPVARAAVMRNVQSNETVSGQMNRLMNEDSDYMKINKQQARRRMSGRGMADTSVGMGAIREAAIKSAMPIASQDANIYSQSSQYNTQMQNDFINSENQFDRTRYLQDDNQQHQNANREDSQYESRENREDLQYENRVNREDQQEYASQTREDNQYENRANREDTQAYGTNERLGKQDFQDANREDTQAYNDANREDVQAYGTSERIGQEDFQNKNREDTQSYNDANREDLQEFEKSQVEGVQKHEITKLNDQQAHELKQADEAMADYREKAMVDMDATLRKQFLDVSASMQASTNQQITAVYSNPNMTSEQQDAAVSTIRANGQASQEWLTESVGVLNNFDVDLGGLNVQIGRASCRERV